MKRIYNDITYNTDTATFVQEITYLDYNGWLKGESVMRTPEGHLFFHNHRYEYSGTVELVEWISPIDNEDQRFLAYEHLYSCGYKKKAETVFPDCHPTLKSICQTVETEWRWGAHEESGECSDVDNAYVAMLIYLEDQKNSKNEKMLREYYRKMCKSLRYEQTN